MFIREVAALAAALPDRDGDRTIIITERQRFRTRSPKLSFVDGTPQCLAELIDRAAPQVGVLVWFCCRAFLHEPQEAPGRTSGRYYRPSGSYARDDLLPEHSVAHILFFLKGTS